MQAVFRDRKFQFLFSQLAPLVPETGGGVPGPPGSGCPCLPTRDPCRPGPCESAASPARFPDSGRISLRVFASLSIAPFSANSSDLNSSLSRTLYPISKFNFIKPNF